MFDLVEQTRQMQDETFNYSVIKLIVSSRTLPSFVEHNIIPSRSH